MGRSTIEANVLRYSLLPLVTVPLCSLDNPYSLGYHCELAGPLTLGGNAKDRLVFRRSREGGLRFGEMERDSMIAHGCGQFLKERLVDTSDIYTTWVCSKCGLIATKKPDKDVWICNSCSKLSENQLDIPYASKVVMPYAFKLLIQELMAINILPRIKINDQINI